ncbi:MAG: hypothetical protein RJA81_2432 [Planctomycetota bacterium]
MKSCLLYCSLLILGVNRLILGGNQNLEKRPNIIVILSDDMGFSDLGCYGGEIQTPNLDSLAANGLRFTQFYNTARCCPTRASLLTGLYPHQAGVGHMLEDKGKPGYTTGLNRNCQTIAEVLKPAGYGTYAVGKWHVTNQTKADGPKDNWPVNRGFQKFYGTIHGAGSFYDPSSLVRDDTMISPYADPEYQPKTYYYTDAISDHAIRFISDHSTNSPEKPFFLYVAYTAAHWPMHALPEDIAKYQGKYDSGYAPIREARLAKAKKLGIVSPDQAMTPGNVDWNSIENKDWEAAGMEVYAAMVDRMDQGIGRIMGQLKASNQFENTLIFFMQDNGGCAENMGRKGNEKHPDIVRPERPSFAVMKPEEFAAGGSVPSQTRDGFPVRMGQNAYPGTADTYVAYGPGWANVSNTPFREFKHWVHEGGISTPLIAHWPSGITARGELRHEPGHLIDIAATCVDLAGANYPEIVNNQPITKLPGKSLVPVFENRPLDRDAIYWEHEGNRAIRIGNLKLVAKGPGSDWELYDISKDRAEMHDMASQLPEKVREMKNKWETWAKSSQVLPWIWNVPYGSQNRSEATKTKARTKNQTKKKAQTKRQLQ